MKIYSDILLIRIQPSLRERLVATAKAQKIAASLLTRQAIERELTTLAARSEIRP